jgi:ribosome-associated translation inhibitor RaiA
VEARVRRFAARLERFNDRIVGCSVVIEAPPAHHVKGAPFSVRIDITVPGREISARNDRAEHADIYAALRDAFDAVTRRLQDHAREQRGDVKAHSLPSQP